MEEYVKYRVFCKIKSKKQRTHNPSPDQIPTIRATAPRDTGMPTSIG